MAGKWQHRGEVRRYCRVSMEDGIFRLEGKTNSERIHTSRFFILYGWSEEGRGDIQVRKGRGSERLFSVIIKRGKKELRKRISASSVLEF